MCRLKKNNVRFERFEIFGPIFSTITMFKVSNIRCRAIINIIFFKHFNMFVIEASDDLRNYLFLDRRFEELFYSLTTGLGNFFSSTDSLREFFYSSTNHLLRKLWCVELYFLIFLIVFIHKVCYKMSNRNIPDPNGYNQ